MDVAQTPGAVDSADADARTLVVLDRLPVALFLRSEQHADDLLRELVLLAQAGTDGTLGVDGDEFVREAVRCLTAVHPVRSAVALCVSSAEEPGGAALTVRVPLPRTAARDLRACARVLDRLTRHCVSGVMLTVPPSPDVVAFRAWYVGELTGQLDRAAAPTSWTDRPAVPRPT